MNEAAEHNSNDVKEASIYKDGKEDARVSTEKQPVDNPFRQRYRPLSPPEVAHHDDIKSQAYELLKTMRNTLKVRSDAGQTTSGEELACLKLAERHLEDAVYRAVKALTA